MDDIRTYLEVMLEHRERSDGKSYNGMKVGECRKKIQKSLQDPKVKLLMEHLEKSGCPINPNKFINGIYCLWRASAGYSPGLGVNICCNHLRFQDEVTQAVIHELIHAYDDCRAKNLDWINCYHRACTEIRASHLSGDCHYMREYLRGHSDLRGLRGHEPNCVRRRAATSVRAYPRCTEYLTNLALDAVWDMCYNDSKPFDKAP